MNRKQRFWKKFSKDRSDENFAKYKLAEKQCKKGVQDGANLNVKLQTVARRGRFQHI